VLVCSYVPIRGDSNLLGEFRVVQGGGGSLQLDDFLGVSFFLTHNPEAFVPSDCVGCATIFPLNDVPAFFDFNASNTPGFSNFLFRLQDTTDDTLLAFTVLNDTLFSGQGGGGGNLESSRFGSSLNAIRNSEIVLIRLIVNAFEVADTETGHTRFDDVTWQFWEILTLAINIQPNSDSNSINCNNDQKPITVAILTTEDFDATTVDHTTVTFEGASERHVNRRSEEPRRHENDVDHDGDTDLEFHFRQGETELTCESTEGTLTGETFDGMAIVGVDSINMVGGTTVITVGQPIP